MQKCPKCGTEFEGKFCPECGEEFKENKKCPQCGAECVGGVKFCPSCGYAFYAAQEKQEPAIVTAETPPKPQKTERVFDEKTTATFKKVHGVLSNVPVILFLLFTFLTFMFFFAPVAVTPSLFGDEPGESYGNMYNAFAGGMDELSVRGCAIAAMFFAILNVPILYLHLNFNYRKALKFNEVELFKLYRVRVENILEAVGWVEYLVFIIISAVIMGKLGAEENLGLALNGLGTILILTSSIVCLVLSVAARLVDSLVIMKNFPQFEEEPPTPYEYTEPQPVKPETVEKPQSPLLKEKDLLRFAVLNRLHIFTLWLVLVYELGAFLIGLSSPFIGSAWTIVYIVYPVLPILLYAVSIILFIIINKPKKTDLKFNIKKTTIFNILLLLLPAAIVIWWLIRIRSFITLDFNSGYNINIFAIFSAILIIANIVLLTLLIKSANKCKILIYGQTKIKDINKATLTEYGNSFSNEYNTYLKDVEIYKNYQNAMSEYKATARKYNFENEMCAAGVDYKDTWARRAFWTSKHKIASSAIALAVLAAIVLITVLPVVLPDYLSVLAMNGTYYYYTNDDYVKDNYIIISGDTWEDDDGVKGNVKRDGDKLSFVGEIDSIMGKYEGEIYSGTYLSDGVILLDFGGSERYYCKEGKTPPDDAG